MVDRKHGGYKYTHQCMSALEVALVDEETMPPGVHCNELHVGKDTRCSQDHRDPDTPWEIESHGLGGGGTGPFGHGAVNGIVS